MAIQKFNSLDIKSGNAAEEYLLQALANLGQRYNIKGDGFDVFTVKFYDSDNVEHSLVSLMNPTYVKPEEALMGCIKYDNDNDNAQIWFVDEYLNPIGEPVPMPISSTINEVHSQCLLKYVLKNLIDCVNTYETYDVNTLYIPLDYEFEYVYNTNNPSQIYFNSKDVVVSFLPNEDLENSKQIVTYYAENSYNIISCIYEDVEKMASYKYSVEYNDEEKTVSGVPVELNYYFPYIDEEGYWYINGHKSNIFGKGQNAGNPNIAIVDSSAASEDTAPIILSADQEVFNGLSWKKETVNIKLPTIYVKNGQYSQEAQYVECDFYLPNLYDDCPLDDHEIEEKFKYCIIINISSSNEYLEQFEADSRVSSIWIFDIDSKKFKCLTKTNEGTEYAIDFNYLSNMDNMVSWAIDKHIPADPDNFLYSFLVFDEVQYQLKNNGEPIPIWPVIYNKVYNKTTFQNRFNIAIEYVDNIGGEKYSYSYLPETSYGSNNASYFKRIAYVGHDDKRYHLDDWIACSGDGKVSNALYAYDVGESYLEYLPNVSSYSVPVLDLAEVLVKNNTVLNRTNIMSLDKAGTLYYAYLGTDYTSDEKSTLVLGTSNHDINIGTNTMTKDMSYNSFAEHLELDINFDNTRISSYAYIVNDAIFEKDTITYRTNWTKHTIDAVAYWNTIYRPVGKFDENIVVLNNANTPSYINALDNSENMFAKCIIVDNYTTNSQTEFASYAGDAIILNSLFNAIMPQASLANLSVTSNKEVIKLDNEPKLLKVSSAFSTEEAYTSNIYTGMPLNITYYENDGVHVNIEEDRTFSSFGTLFRITEDYQTQS